MDGIHFVESKSDGAILKTAGLPPAYCEQNVLTQHLESASFSSAILLNLRQHKRPDTGEVFRCTSYYAASGLDSAFCSREDFGFLSVVGMPLVRRLVKICHLLVPALALRPRAGQDDRQGSLQQSSELNALLEGTRQVDEEEVLELVSRWPPTNGSTQMELSEFTIFYDMVRLIWLHEWAHALCGHVSLLQQDMGINRLFESRPEFVDVFQPEVMQALELHADEFAARNILNDILWGHDPVASIVGPKIDLVDRLLMFNIASCVFAIVWTLGEAKHDLYESYWAEKSSEQRFRVIDSTHPPAVLRYVHFRGFQRNFTASYGQEQGVPEFSVGVDSYSFSFLKVLGELSHYFLYLQRMTPLLARTPTYKALEDYSLYMENISRQLVPAIKEHYFVPTAEKW